MIGLDHRLLLVLLVLVAILEVLLGQDEHKQHEDHDYLVGHIFK